MRADAVIVPVNPMYKTAEIGYLAEDSGATVAIVGGELCDVFAPLLGNALAHAVVTNYRDEVPADTPYTLPACVTQVGEPPRSPGWFRWQEAITGGSTGADDGNAGRSCDHAIYVRHDRQAEGLHAQPSSFDRNPPPFVVRLTRSIKHGHAARLPAVASLSWQSSPHKNCRSRRRGSLKRRTDVRHPDILGN